METGWCGRPSRVTRSCMRTCADVGAPLSQAASTAIPITTAYSRDAKKFVAMATEDYARPAQVATIGDRTVLVVDSNNGRARAFTPGLRCPPRPPLRPPFSAER